MLRKFAKFFGILAVSSCFVCYLMDIQSFDLVKHKRSSIASIRSGQSGIQQKSKLEQVNTFCKSHPDVQLINTDNQGFYYLNGHFFYCDIPKLGSSFLKALFPKVFGCDGIDKQLFNDRNLSDHVFSFINVGDPYRRLFSAYKDKIYTPDVIFWRKIGKDVVKTVRTNDTKAHSGFDVTFREIVQYVVHHHESGIELNQHLKPIHKVCNPCRTRFDFIGKTDTLSGDLANMFGVLKNTRIVKKEVNITRLKQTIKSDERQIIGKVERLFLAVRRYPYISAYKLFLRLWTTYQMDGAILDCYEMPFPASKIRTVSPRQYELALVNAVNKSKDFRDELLTQRHEALIQAYRTVPLTIMSRLREFVKTDCSLFSYDDKPSLLFDRETFNGAIRHMYMKDI